MFQCLFVFFCHFCQTNKQTNKQTKKTTRITLALVIHTSYWKNSSLVEQLIVATKLKWLQQGNSPSIRQGEFSFLFRSKRGQNMATTNWIVLASRWSLTYLFAPSSLTFWKRLNKARKQIARQLQCVMFYKETQTNVPIHLLNLLLFISLSQISAMREFFISSIYEFFDHFPRPKFPKHFLYSTKTKI